MNREMAIVNSVESVASAEKTQTIDRLEKPEIYKDFVTFVALPKFARLEKYGYDTENDFFENNDVSASAAWKWKQREHFLRDLQLAQRTYLATNSKFAEKLALLDDNRLVREFREFVYPKDDKPAIQITNIEQFTHNDLDLFISEIADMVNDDDDDD